MTNLIVSGIERSGTSMMMQILLKGGVPVAFEDSRPADMNNPRGYFELEGGKIIRKVMDGSFPFEEYEDRFIKITAYGLKFLPKSMYKIIFMKRDLDEVMDSMEKMGGKVDREKERPLFEKLNELSINLMDERIDINFIIMCHNDVMNNPAKEIGKLNQFLEGKLNEKSAVNAVDHSLYRNVKMSKSEEDLIKERLESLGYL